MREPRRVKISRSAPRERRKVERGLLFPKGAAGIVARGGLAQHTKYGCSPTLRVVPVCGENLTST